jgi:hypothetical protein
MSLNLEKIRANRDKAREEAARRNANFYEWKNRNTLRILPPWAGAEDFSRIFGKHWRLGPEGKTMVFCPQICFGAPCPICNNVEAMWKAKPDEATKEWLKEVGASPRFYVNVIDMDDLEAGIQIAEFPKTVIMEIWNLMVDEDAGLKDITHLETGREIIIERNGKGLSTRYSIRPKLTSSPVPIPISIEDLPNLDNFVRKESYENLKLIWEGKEPLPAPEARALPAPEAREAVIDMEVGRDGRHVAPAATPAPVTPAPVAPAPVASAPVAPPAAPEATTCFGNFDESNSACLDCIEQDDCEMKQLEIKRAARKATPPAAAKPAPAAAPAPAAPPAASAISEADLIAEMNAAINR